MTPLLRAPALGAAIGAHDIWLKDEGQNPTASFKARGMSVAVSMAKKLGATRLAAPSAGNAGGALAAYAAAGGMEAHIAMPADVPQANYLECKAAGAHVTLVNGLIGECGRMITERSQAAGWFEVGTLREPYRIEGKKTMDTNWQSNSIGNCPTRNYAPVAAASALSESGRPSRNWRSLAGFERKRPKMIAVQAAGCAPIVRAFAANALRSETWQNPHTVASGLGVPKALGDFLALQAIREVEGRPWRSTMRTCWTPASNWRAGRAFLSRRKAVPVSLPPVS